MELIRPARVFYNGKLFQSSEKFLHEIADIFQAFSLQEVRLSWIWQLVSIKRKFLNGFLIDNDLTVVNFVDRPDKSS